MGEMMQSTQNDAQRWMLEAEKDLRDAELLLRYEGYYPLCRLAYLAAEKAIRGWLLAKGQPVADQPGLAALTRQVEATDPALVPLMTSLHSLEQFAPPSPAVEAQGTSPPPPLYRREAAKEALALARQAVVVVKRSLATPS